MNRTQLELGRGSGSGSVSGSGSGSAISAGLTDGVGNADSASVKAESADLENEKI